MGASIVLVLRKDSQKSGTNMLSPVEVRREEELRVGGGERRKKMQRHVHANSNLNSFRPATLRVHMARAFDDPRWYRFQVQSRDDRYILHARVYLKLLFQRLHIAGLHLQSKQNNTLTILPCRVEEEDRLPFMLQLALWLPFVEQHRPGSPAPRSWSVPYSCLRSSATMGLAQKKIFSRRQSTSLLPWAWHSSGLCSNELHATTALVASVFFL